MQKSIRLNLNFKAQSPRPNNNTKDYALMMIHLNNGTCIYETLLKQEAEIIVETMFNSSDKSLIRVSKADGEHHVLKVGTIESIQAIPVKSIIDINNRLEYEAEIS